MARIKLGLAVLLAACLAVHAQIGRPVMVNIPGMGMAEGNRERSTVYNRPFSAFRGLPFARPPVGELRYKSPVPPEPWKHAMNAKRWGPGCPQLSEARTRELGLELSYWHKVHAHFGHNLTQPEIDPRTGKETIPEDCLCLNVFTPNMDSNAAMPVMIFYHGGSFSWGDSRVYYPDYLMDHDVILIVPHYRLGPLGFLSMQNDEIPGNAGMLDMVEVIKWTKQYIHIFGGDPEEITVFGESSGAASASFLALSPLSRGMIKRVIGESAAAIAEWAFDRDPVYNARGIAKYLGCDMKDDETITRCFMEKPAQDVIEAYQGGWLGEEQKAGRSGFGGSAPTFQTTGEIFLDRAPEEYWKDPDFVPVPSIYGSNKHEGTFVLSGAYDAYIIPNGYHGDTEFLRYDFMKTCYQVFRVVDPGHVITDGIEFEYIGYDRMGNFTAMCPGLIDFIGAAFLKAPGYESVKLHAAKGDQPSFLYSYNFLTLVTVPLCNGAVSDRMPFPGGVCHAAEIAMLFGVPGVWIVMNAKEKAMSKTMVKMWYNFAKYGNPTPDVNPVENYTWPAFDIETEPYMRFDQSGPIVLHDYKKSEYTIAKDENFGL